MSEVETDELDASARQRLGDLRFVGALTQVDANARGLRLLETEHGASAASDHIKLSALVDDQERIADLRFTSLATGLDLLSFEFLAEWCLGKTLDEAAALTPQILSAYIAERGCGFRASEAGAGSERTGYFVLMKLAGRAHADDKTKPSPADALPWREVGLFEKVRRIEAVLDEHVRPALASDGGGMDVVDLKPGDDFDTLVVEYQGACGSCSSALGGTMQFIEDTLEMQLGAIFRLDVQAMEQDEGFFGL